MPNESAAVTEHDLQIGSRFTRRFDFAASWRINGLRACSTLVLS